jgi:hypothetical protein
LVSEPDLRLNSNRRGQCPLRVRRFLPVYPGQRTTSGRPGWSVSCLNRTHAPQQTGRYSITASARASTVSGMEMDSFVTPDDFVSEPEAKFATEKIIRRL